ncbi:MAG TPA: hypothetical protein PK400_04320 [Phycisphaerales bacterium]|nr:hypothetical protein [Phycisphaerales bacterium]HRQ74699.1 hypothetical protein [Phycisphaerales bacterium]
MLRIVLAIIIGYLAIAMTIFIGLTSAYVVLGPEGVFQPGVFDLTTTWVVAAVGINIGAAVVGGIVCAIIARRKSTPLIFAAIVFILGIAFAIPTIASYDAESPARPNDITMREAMMEGRQPTWFAFSNPFIAGIGIILGASLISKRNKPQA